MFITVVPRQFDTLNKAYIITESVQQRRYNFAHTLNGLVHYGLYKNNLKTFSNQLDPPDKINQEWCKRGFLASIFFIFLACTKNHDLSQASRNALIILIIRHPNYV